MRLLWKGCTNKLETLCHPRLGNTAVGFVALLPATQRTHTKHHRCSWNEAHIPAFPVHIYISHSTARNGNTISLACISDHVLFRDVCPYFVCPYNIAAASLRMCQQEKYNLGSARSKKSLGMQACMSGSSFLGWGDTQYGQQWLPAFTR